MLMPKKRFRFNNFYAYGSLAFVLGFGGVMGLLVHTNPMYAPRSLTVGVADTSTNKTSTEQPVQVETASTEAAPTTPQSAPSTSAPQAPAQNAASTTEKVVPQPETAPSKEETTHEAQPSNKSDGLVIDALPIIDLVEIELPFDTKIGL